MPFVRAWLDELRKEGRSDAMLRNVRVSLGSILSDAQERGLVVRNAVKDMGRGKKAKGGTQARHEKPPEVGIDIPTPDEIRAIMRKAVGRDRVFVMTAIFTGMRASELRGLRWSDLDLNRAELTVRQRADAHQEIGSPKSKKGRRSIPLVADLVKTQGLEKDCPPATRILCSQTAPATSNGMRTLLSGGTTLPRSRPKSQSIPARRTRMAIRLGQPSTLGFMRCVTSMRLGASTRLQTVASA